MNPYLVCGEKGNFIQYKYLNGDIAQLWNNLEARPLSG